MELASALGLGFARACRPFHRSLREPRQADSVLAVKEKLASQHSVAEAAGTAELVSSRCSSPAAQLAPLQLRIPPPLLLEASDLLEPPTFEMVEAYPPVVMCKLAVAMDHQKGLGIALVNSESQYFSCVS